MKPLILVTGSKGQLGSEIKELAREHSGYEFMFADIDDLDITDAVAVKTYIDDARPAYIINCAGYTAVDRAEEEPDTAMLTNATSVRNIVHAIEGTGCKLFHISTDYVLNSIDSEPLSEDAKPDPVSAYSISKYHGELNALEYHLSVVIRTSWLYSLHGNNFVKTIIRLASERDEIRVVDDQEGSPTYAADLARAILTMIEKTDDGSIPFDHGIYHYSDEGSCTWYQFATEIASILDLKVKIEPISTEEYPLPAYRPAYSVLRKEKIKNKYSLQIPHWKESLRICLNQL